MNQIIIIGDATKIKELKGKKAVLTITTKDFERKDINVNILIEKGYEKKMIEILKTKPLVAVKCGLRKSNEDNYTFVAEKMSVLKLTSSDSEE